MKLAPVKHYKEPPYPTRDAVLSNPSCLSECVPSSWRANKLVATMLAVYLFGPENGEAQVGGPDRGQPVLVKAGEPSRERISEEEGASRRELPSIAPVFLHGDGRGATGCVIMNPPLFLSEEEARQIIEEELLKERIIFDKKNVKLDEVMIREQYRFGKGEGIAINLDGYSSKYNLGYEVVTAQDYHQLGGPHEGSTVISYDLVKAAENLRDKMKDYGKMNFAVFYDPVQYYEAGQKKNTTYEDRYSDIAVPPDDDSDRNAVVAMRRKSAELLKRQVSDFVDWIKQEALFEKR